MIDLEMPISFVVRAAVGISTIVLDQGNVPVRYTAGRYLIRPSVSQRLRLTLERTITVATAVCIIAYYVKSLSDNF
jgi:hypothetical protein